MASCSEWGVGCAAAEGVTRESLIWPPLADPLLANLRIDLLIRHTVCMPCLSHFGGRDGIMLPVHMNRRRYYRRAVSQSRKRIETDRFGITCTDIGKHATPFCTGVLVE